MANKSKDGGGLSLHILVNETVLIADNCSVSVSAVKGSQVQLNFNFPKEVPIDRVCIRSEKHTSNQHSPGLVVFQKGQINADT